MIPTRYRPLPSVLASLLTLLGACAGAPDAASIEDVEVGSGEEALALLVEGNKRFVAGRPRHSHESMARRAKLSGGQDPYAIVLGCADSRVPPELLFDAGLGDLFVIRVAGNVVGEDEAGSIEYSIEHLGTLLVVVLGHESCGAVTAALSAGHEKEIAELAHLLSVIAPALRDIDPKLPHKEKVMLGVEANVRQSMKRLTSIQDRINTPEARAIVVGAVYDLDTGRVRILDR